MRTQSQSYHLCTLEYASEEMLKFPRSERFIKWVIRSIFAHLKPFHVSIALLDTEKKSFPIKYSSGRFRFPASFVALNQSNPLLQLWVDSPPSRHSHSKSLYLRNGLVPEHPEVKEAVLEDLSRHRTQICVKIQTSAALLGYLLVGPRENDLNYTPQDLAYFETLANDIAIEIELEKYYQSSSLDPLTHLYNRYSLKSKFEGILEQSREKQRMFAVAMVDLDNFKSINDRYGHLTGDEVLRISAGIIQKNIRQPDVPFRYGGEEFLILFPLDSRSQPAQKIDAQEFRNQIFRVVERLRIRLASQPILCTSESLHISASIGLSFFDGRNLKTVEKLIAEADESVYASKKAGKNRITIYGELESPSVKRLASAPTSEEYASGLVNSNGNGSRGKNT